MILETEFRQEKSFARFAEKEPDTFDVARPRRGIVRLSNCAIAAQWMSGFPGRVEGRLLRNALPCLTEAPVEEVLAMLGIR